MPLGISGSRTYMYEEFGLSAERLCASVTDALAVNRS
jgi:hypothetical protein